MKNTANTIFFGFRRYFGVVVIKFSTLTMNFVQTTTSNSIHGPNRTNDMVELGSGSCTWRNRHQKPFWRVICQFSGAKHASSRHSLKVECGFLDDSAPMDYVDRTNMTLPGHEAVSRETNAKYLFLRQTSDLGPISAAKHVNSRHTL